MSKEGGNGFRRFPFRAGGCQPVAKADVFFARNEIRMLILHQFDLDDAMNEPRLLIVIN